MVPVLLRGIGCGRLYRILLSRLTLVGARIHELLHPRSQVFGSLLSTKVDEPALYGFPVFILRAVEERVPLGLRHFQNGLSLALALLFL